jgi:hypothetical protein
MGSSTKSHSCHGVTAKVEEIAVVLNIDCAITQHISP